MKTLPKLPLTRWLVAIALVVTLLVARPPARAINAIVSQDLPLLSQIAATETAQYLELGAILTQVAAVVKQVKQYTTIAKTAWGGVQELRQMNLDRLKELAYQGVNAALPELQEIRGDIRDIRDLDYRDYAAMAAIRGMLWHDVYGPGLGYLNRGLKKLAWQAEVKERKEPTTAKAVVTRAVARKMADTCKDALSGSRPNVGKCNALNHQTSFDQTALLADLSESTATLVEAQRQALATHDEKRVDSIQSFDRWHYDIEQYMRQVFGDPSCRGNCLYETYGTYMHRAVHARRVQDLRRLDQEYEERHAAAKAARQQAAAEIGEPVVPENIGD